MEIVKWILGYLGIGLAVAMAFGCWCRSGRLDDHLSEDELEGLWFVLLLWPIAVLAVPVAVVIAAIEMIKDTEWWKRLPDSSDLYPVEWLFCWPAKLYELWSRHNGQNRRRHERG